MNGQTPSFKELKNTTNSQYQKSTNVPHAPKPIDMDYLKKMNSLMEIM